MVADALLSKMGAVWLVGLVALCVGAAHSRRNTVVLSDDVYPGFTVKKFHGQNSVKYKLLETGYSGYFAVLDDGLVMTTTDLDPLVNRPVDLVVLEESGNTTSSHTLHVRVLERRDIMKFPRQIYEGKVRENLPPGTRIQDLPELRVRGSGSGGPVKYAIVAGDERGAFGLEEASAGGVFLITAKSLDRERRSAYRLALQAADARGIDRTTVKIHVKVEDDNDNAPVFLRNDYRFKAPFYDNSTGHRLASIGFVRAEDKDGDRVAYRLSGGGGFVVVVPQTGELLLAGPVPPSGVHLTIRAHDLRSPSLVSLPASVHLEYDSDAAVDSENSLVAPLHRDKRRVTRAVRPTKRIDFTEADGETEGRIVFQLEKETERETFKIRDENPWVTVEPNGAVRVKKKWDYEELGPEKTIDFWVTITNAGVGGPYPSQPLQFNSFFFS